MEKRERRACPLEPLLERDENRKSHVEPFPGLVGSTARQRSGAGEVAGARQRSPEFGMSEVRLPRKPPGKALPGVVRISKDLDQDIHGMDVLLIEDIVDTGLTLRYLLNVLSGRQPSSLAVCTFLDKATRRLVDIPVKYRCFEIPDRFVVGFGLDYNQRYRTLPCVGILKSQIYSK